MGTTFTKEATAKNQSKTTATTPVLHQTLTSARRASLNSNSGERRSSVSGEGKERRPSLTREPSDPTRPTVVSSSKTVDNISRPRRASVRPRISTVMEEAPTVRTSTKTQASSRSNNIFAKCCGVSGTA